MNLVLREMFGVRYGIDCGIAVADGLLNITNEENSCNSQYSFPIV